MSALHSLRYIPQTQHSSFRCNSSNLLRYSLYIAAHEHERIGGEDCKLRVSSVPIEQAGTFDSFILRLCAVNAKDTRCAIYHLRRTCEEKAEAQLCCSLSSQAPCPKQHTTSAFGGPSSHYNRKYRREYLMDKERYEGCHLIRDCA